MIQPILSTLAVYFVVWWITLFAILPNVIVINAKLPLPPPKGSIQVIYTFVVGGETHFAAYVRYPKDKDLTAAFDTMITKTLHLSA